jgi:hypothetical protein
MAFLTLQAMGSPTACPWPLFSYLNDTAEEGSPVSKAIIAKVKIA